MYVCVWVALLFLPCTTWLLSLSLSRTWNFEFHTIDSLVVNYSKRLLQDRIQPGDWLGNTSGCHYFSFYFHLFPRLNLTEILTNCKIEFQLGSLDANVIIEFRGDTILMEFKCRILDVFSYWIYMYHTNRDEKNWSMHRASYYFIWCNRIHF